MVWRQRGKATYDVMIVNAPPAYHNDHLQRNMNIADPCTMNADEADTSTVKADAKTHEHERRPKVAAPIETQGQLIFGYCDEPFVPTDFGTAPAPAPSTPMLLSWLASFT